MGQTVHTERINNITAAGAVDQEFLYQYNGRLGGVPKSPQTLNIKSRGYVLRRFPEASF